MSNANNIPSTRSNSYSTDDSSVNDGFFESFTGIDPLELNEENNSMCGFSDATAVSFEDSYESETIAEYEQDYSFVSNDSIPELTLQELRDKIQSSISQGYFTKALELWEIVLRDPQHTPEDQENAIKWNLRENKYLRENYLDKSVGNALAKVLYKNTTLKKNDKGRKLNEANFPSSMDEEEMTEETRPKVLLLRKLSRQKLASLYKQRRLLVRRKSKIRKQARILMEQLRLGKDISERQKYQALFISSQMKAVSKIIASQQKLEFVQLTNLRQKEISEETFSKLDTRTSEEIEEKTEEWKKIVSDYTPLRLIRALLSSRNSKSKYWRIYEIFEELLHDPDNLKGASLHDLRRLAEYFSKIHPPHTVSVLEAALDQGFNLTHDDYHLLLVSHRKTKDRLGIVEAFEEMRGKGFALRAVDYSELLRCLMSKGGKDTGLAKRYLNEVRSQQFRLDMDAYAALIDGFIVNNDVFYAGQIFMDFVKEGLAAPGIIFPKKPVDMSGSEIYTILVQTFIHQNDLDKAKKFYGKLLTVNPSPDFELVQMIVDACLNRNEMITARLLLKRTRTSNLGCIYGQVIEYCAMRKKFKHLWMVYAQSLDRKITLSEKTYRLMLLAYYQEGYLTDVLTLYRESKFLGYFRKDLYIHNLVARILVNNERIEQAQEVLLDIQQLGLTPNVDTYRIMINFAEVQKNSKNAMQVFQEMRRKKFSADRVTLLYLIRCLCAAGDFEGSKMVIDLMQRNNMKPNIHHYNALMKAYGSKRDEDAQTELNIIDSKIDPSNNDKDSLSNHPEIKNVLNIFNVIRNSNLFPNANTFHIIIEAFAKAGNFEMAKKIYKAMSELTIQPTLEIFHIILRNLIKTQGIENAANVFWDQVNANIFKSMSTKYVMPDYYTWNMMMEYALKHENVGVATEIYGGMWERGMSMRVSGMYGNIMKLLIGKNDLEMAERILKHMCIGKVEDDEVSRGFSMLTNEYWKLGKLEKMEDLWESLEKLNDLRSNAAWNKRILINKIACEYMIKCFIKNRNEDGARKVGEMIIENGINVDLEMLKGWISELT
ncbi:14656_t:CDS:2 [Acaulospora morrowiae]|uniref:14656_t:CDS:1 n=1 Tax=Acaulospora morrowiae TaxID=94023 RepID=A0A9N9F9F8_9GLOM|nr:14656_t:CDS:2 [Acaulospora morrowiae]